ARMVRALFPFAFRAAQPHTSTPFPYTTLFRSPQRSARKRPVPPRRRAPTGAAAAGTARFAARAAPARRRRTCRSRAPRSTAAERSEEHTSELQSRENLVCRLLLEKKD